MRRSRSGPFDRPVACGMALALIAMLGLSGCSHGSASQPTTAATGPLQAIATKRGATVPGAAFAQRVAVAITRAGSARFTVSSSQLGKNLASGALQVQGADTAISVTSATGTTGGSQLRMVLLPGAVYVDTGQQVQGKDWVKLGSVTGSVTAKLLAPVVSRVASAADVGSLNVGWASVGHLTVGRTSRIGRTTAVEYDATLPRSAVLAGLTQQLRSVLGSSVTDSTARVWLDPSGRPLRVATSSTLDGQPLSMTVTYADWGHGPVVHAPAASDVASLSPF